MQLISKNIFINAVFCNTLGWRLRHHKIQRGFSPGELFRMEQGKEIGSLARKLYPEGIFVNELNAQAAAAQTKGLMNDRKIRVIFEATFLAGNYIAKADILVRDGESWELIEVKSSVSAKEEFIDDMAYTVMVAHATGFLPSKISLVLVDKNYRLGMPIEKLFAKNDLTPQILIRINDFEKIAESIDSMSNAPDEPTPYLTYNCKQCEEFDECLGKEIEAHIFEIPRIQQKTVEKLIASNILTIHEIPDNFPLTDNQKRVVQCVKCGEMHIDPALKAKLSAIRWPAFYLDFETMMTAIPLWSDVAPYDQIPIQYSLHICESSGKILTHKEYLADPHRDCRRKLAEQLISDLRGEGSIITYSSFEKTTILKLSKTFSDISNELQTLIDRIVDLEQCIKCVNHPKFCGRTSIKITLPVLVPDLSYEGLEIANGDVALVTFAMMAQGKLDDHEMERKRTALLEYCKMDTMAMVRLHEKLIHLSSDF